MTEGSRFTPPWTIEETQACFFVKDFRGQKLAYTYSEDELGRRANQAHTRRGAPTGCQLAGRVLINALPLRSISAIGAKMEM